MAYNKVEYNGQTLIDLTGDTVTAEDVLEGVTFHAKDGRQMVGTLKRALPYWATIRCTGAFTPSTSYQYWGATGNGTVEHEERGFGYGRANGYVTSAYKHYYSYFIVPAGVSKVELHCHIPIEQGTANSRRYTATACVSKDLNSAPYKATPMSHVLTPALASTSSLQGVMVLDVEEGDMVYVRCYKSAAGQALTSENVFLYIKAIE